MEIIHISDHNTECEFSGDSNIFMSIVSLQYMFFRVNFNWRHIQLAQTATTTNES